MTPSCTTITVCRCCGHPFSETRKQSANFPANCRPCVNGEHLPKGMAILGHRDMFSTTAETDFPSRPKGSSEAREESGRLLHRDGVYLPAAGTSAEKQVGNVPADAGLPTAHQAQARPGNSKPQVLLGVPWNYGRWGNPNRD